MSEESTANLQFSLKAVSPDGFEHLVVWRDDRPEEESGPSAIKRIVFAMKVMEKHLLEAGFRPAGRVISMPPMSSSSSGQDPRPSSSPAANQVSGYGGEGHEGVAVGTVLEITVQKEKETGVRLGFHLDNRNLPVYAIGATEEYFETHVRPLFDDNVFTERFTWEDLHNTKRSYDAEDFGDNLKAVSGKAKYWDILRVYRTE